MLRRSISSVRAFLVAKRSNFDQFSRLTVNLSSRIVRMRTDSKMTLRTVGTVLEADHTDRALRPALSREDARRQCVPQSTALCYLRELARIL